jgi:hypothetical protein
MELPKIEVTWTDAWLHTSCVETTDEAPEGGSLTSSNTPEWRLPAAKPSMDWRQGPRPVAGVGAFNINKQQCGWKPRQRSKRFSHASRHIDAHQGGSNLKYCPGDECHVWLPVHQFASNSNMRDGMDMYCIECNARRRQEQEERRGRFEGSGVVIDSFERFCCAEDMAVFNDSAQKSAVLGTVNQAILDARIHKGLTVPVSGEVIYAKLFDGRRLMCNITDRALTPSCFLDHHDITFRQKGARLDVNCTNCKLPTSD